MQSVAIICEYNPFHNGHLHHVQKIRQTYKDHVVIAIMSGQFVQRGEPAFYNKFIRTKMALQYCDLVVELPQFYAVSYADDFAYGGVSVANALNANILSFGSEITNMNTLNTFIQDIKAKKALPKENKQSYAQSMFKNLNIQSNTILALQYMMHIENINPSIQIHPIKRIQNDYKDTTLSGEISSATSIRTNLLANKDISHTVPNSTKNLIQQNGVTLSQFYPYIRFLLLQQDHTTLKNIYTMYEGLEHRFILAAKQHENFNDFFKAIQTKRYTNARLQRLLIYLLLNIKESDKLAYNHFSHIRVLGMNNIGRAYIKYLKNTKPDVKCVTNMNQAASKHFPLELKATQIYNLISRSEENDFNTPVIR